MVTRCTLMIRKIEEKDIPVILNWYNWYIRNSTATFETEELTLDEFKQRVAFITEKYPWIILEEDGKPVGYAYYFDFNSRQAYACTVDLAIYLDPNACHHGYGKILMNEMIRIARKSGYKNIVSLVTTGNIASEKLHERFGFVKKATFEDIGNKHNQWLAVSYYYLQLESE